MYIGMFLYKQHSKLVGFTYYFGAMRNKVKEKYVI